MTRDEIQGQINAYKLLLSQTDYKALKHADGAMTDEEYAETREQRAQYRSAINALEAEIEAMDVADLIAASAPSE